MTNLSADLFGLPPDIQAVSHAILNQESGNNPNSPTSINGAVGRAQIIPATFKQYALPGEDINNPDDNVAVHNRIIADLAEKANNDPARIAVGYFSGPGNMSSSGAATPYKADHADGNGKTVSSYASDVVGRITKTTPLSNQTTQTVRAPAQGRDLSAELFGDTPPTPPQETPSIIQKRGQQGWDAIHAYQRGEQSLPETALQLMGNAGAGAISDVAGSALSHIYKNIIPDQQRQNIADTGKYLADTQVGRALGDVGKSAISEVGGLAKQYPRAARNLEAVGNIATVLPIGSAATSTVGSGLEAAGSAIEQSGKTSAMKARTKFVQDLITPKETQKVAEDLFSRSTEKGLLKTRVVQPSVQEQAIMDTVSQLPIKKGNSLLANHNIIEDANIAEADRLKTYLQANDVPIDSAHVAQTLDNTNNLLKQNPYITGDGAKAADNVMVGALQAIKVNPRTASGMLQARKDFDAWIKSQKKDTIFNAAVDSPASVAIRQVRQTMNKMIGDAVPSAQVADSLAQQSNMYRAMEAIQSKGAREGKNRLTRGVQKVVGPLTAKNLAVKGALGTLGAGATMASAPLTGVGLGLYGLSRPAVRIGLGKTLKATGNFIK